MEPDVSYSYDLLGRLTAASQTGHSLSFTYDALGRNLTQAGPLGTVSSQWDIGGRRTRLTYPDNFYVTYDHLVTGEVTAIRDTGVGSGLGVIATIAHDDLGRRTSLPRGNGVVTGYQYDAVSRLSQLTQDFAATANDLTLGFAYNPASQIVARTASNDLYAWTGHGNGTTSTSADGLNRIDSWVSTLGYDAKGNVTSDGNYTYAYSSENLLTSLTNPSGMVQTASAYAYDPMMRLANIDSSNAALDVQLGYDGDEIIFEGLSDSRTRRYVFGPGVDEPLVAYLTNSSGTSRTWYQADERGSIIRLSSDSGAAGGVGKYDEYGVGTGVGRFHYTGQYWLADANLHYYRARIYDPRLGRFLQADPIGYGGGMNLYAYVAGDPVNFTDPSGLCGVGEVPVSRPRISRPEGDVVALYSFFCMRLLIEEDGGGLSGDTGDGGGGKDVQADDKACPTDREKAAAAAKGLVTALEIARLGPAAILLTPFLLTGDTPQQYVVRGGLGTPQGLIDGTRTFPYKGGTLSGFSAYSAPNMSQSQIAVAANIPHSSISYTTVRDLASMSISVISTPARYNKYHVTVSVPAPLDPKLAEKISNSLSRMPNPNKCK